MTDTKASGYKWNKPVSRTHEIAPLTEAEKELVERNLHVAEIAAKQVCKRSRGMVSYGEALASASYGMIRAVKRFDGSKASFGTSSSPRAKGQISDDLRLRSRWFFYGPARSKLDMGSLDSMTRFEESGKERSLGDSVLVSREPAVDANLESHDEFESLLKDLDGREREVLRMAFVKDMTLDEIGKATGYHESRISQIKTAALEKLRVHHSKEKQDGNSHR